MLSPDRGILAAVMTEGRDGLKKLLEKSFSPTLLADIDCRKAIGYIKEFNEDFGELPSKGLLDSRFPDLVPDSAPQGVLYYLNELDRRHRFSIIKNANSAVAALMDSRTLESLTNGVDDATQVLIEAARKLTLDSVHANTFDITKTTEERIEQYNERKKSDGITGIPTYWLPLTITTRGWQKGHTYCIAGPSGVGKTFALTLNALAARNKGYVALLFTQEMSQVEIATRYDAVSAKVHYGRLLSGKLTPEEEDTYFDYLNKLQTEENHVPFYVNEKAGGKGIDYIVSQIEDLKPDIVFIDNIYLFAKSLDYKDILEVSSKLKNLAQKLSIPIVFCTQMNDEGKLSFAKYVKNDVSGSYKIFDLAPHKMRRLVDDKARDNGKTSQFAFHFDFELMNFDHNADFSLDSDNSYEDVLDDLY